MALNFSVGWAPRAGGEWGDISVVENVENGGGGANLRNAIVLLVAEGVQLR